MHRIDWSNQIVLVTGGERPSHWHPPADLPAGSFATDASGPRSPMTGCSGVGKAIVDILDLKKVTVVVLDRTLPDSGSQDYNDTHFYQCDVSDPKRVAEVAETIKKEVRMGTHHPDSLDASF